MQVICIGLDAVKKVGGERRWTSANEEVSDVGKNVLHSAIFHLLSGSLFAGVLLAVIIILLLLDR